MRTYSAGESRILQSEEGYNGIAEVQEQGCVAMTQPIKSVYDLNSWRSNANDIKDDKAAAAATATHLSGLNRTYVPCTKAEQHARLDSDSNFILMGRLCNLLSTKVMLVQVIV